MRAACKTRPLGRTVWKSSDSENHDIRPKAPTRRSCISLRKRMVSSRSDSIVGKFEFNRAAVPTGNPSWLQSYQVLVRILLRFILLIAFATLGSQGFGQTFAALL